MNWILFLVKDSIRKAFGLKRREYENELVELILKESAKKQKKRVI